MLRIMPEALTARFACNACGRTYRWRPELAGRRVKCAACGHVMAAPAEPPGADDDLYDIVEPAVRASRVVPQARRVESIDYRRPTTTAGQSSALEKLFPDRVKDLYLPLALIGGGSVIEIGFVVLFERFTAYRAMRIIALELIGSTAILALAAFIAGKARKIEFGPPAVALLKLCAVGMGAFGLNILLGPLVIVALGWMPYVGWVSVFLVPLAAYYTLLGALFDLDPSDARYCVSVFFVVNVAIYFALKWL
jgi:hypothetical protein